MNKSSANTRIDSATPQVEEFDARIKVMSEYLTEHLDAPGDFPSVTPSNCLDLRDLRAHLAERKARRRGL
jgi:hypothetical protein